MLQLQHPNVVRMIGVAIQQKPWLCVLEFMFYGDLRAALLVCNTISCQTHTRTQREKERDIVILISHCEGLQGERHRARTWRNVEFCSATVLRVRLHCIKGWLWFVIVRVPRLWLYIFSRVVTFRVSFTWIWRAATACLRRAILSRSAISDW